MYSFSPSSETELIRDTSPAVRPLTRMATLGSTALSDAELLTLILRSKSLISAEKVLEGHVLADLLAMPYDALARIKNIGENGAAALIAAAELTRRADKTINLTGPTLRTVNDIALQSIEIRDKQKEYLLAFFVNARHHLIEKSVVSIGTLTQSLAHPREVLAPAIGSAAAGFYLVHNHPSGDPSPSDEDIRLTQRIKQAGHIMGIELLDHVIVAKNGTYSFKTEGRI